MTKTKIYNSHSEKEMKERLISWKEKYERAKSEYQSVLNDVQTFNRYLQGTLEMINYDATNGKSPKPAKLTRNICYELIEAQIDNNIPTPKVTATNEKDINNAIKIENKMRNEVDRLNFETMLDLVERSTPTDGGSFFHVEWDNSYKDNDVCGNISVKTLSALQVIPQPGIFEINDMDYIFVRISDTKKHIFENYGVEVWEEIEDEIDFKSITQSNSDELVTQIICYYKNENGSIGKFSFAGDTVLEDIEDYQARILRKCKECGEIVFDEEVCPKCGSKKFYYDKVEYEEIEQDIIRISKTPDGQEVSEVYIPKGTKIPYFKPNVYPIVLRRNVSRFGTFLGSSDIELIKYQQDIINKCETDSLEKMLKGGSIVTLPRGLKFEKTDENFRVVEVDRIEQIEMIKAFNIQPDNGRIDNYAEMQYQRARQILGITDSYQGRKDSSANSGAAKQIQVQQTAGRLESKRIMKNAAFAELYRIMTMFLIAFADEPRTLVIDTTDGESIFDTFSKYDFVKFDENNNAYYSFDYLFSTDNTGTLAVNREAMWQEHAQNLARGGFGNLQDPETLILFWQSMKESHYPNAGKILSLLKGKIQKQEQMEMLMQENEQLKQQLNEMGVQADYFKTGIEELQKRNEELYEESELYRTGLELEQEGGEY